MMNATTFFGPSASAASVATRLESTPPLKPSTTRSNPTLRTSLRMKPTRMPRTNSGLIRSGGKTGSERLAGALMPDPTEFVDGQLEPLVAQQRIGKPLAPDLPEVDGGQDERLVGVFLLRDDVAVGADHHGTAPEVRAVLIPDPVAVEEEGRQELGVGAADEAVRLRGSQPLVGRDPAPRAGRRTDDHVHAFETQDVGAGEVPDVFADKYPGPAESGLETAKAITRREIALLVEHAIGRQVDLAVDVDQLAPAEIEAGVEVAMIGLFDHRAQYDVQPIRQAAQLVHDGTLDRDRAFSDEVLEEIAGQAELREDQQLDAGLFRLTHPVPVAFQVARAVTERRVQLRQPDREPAVLAHAGTRLESGTPPPRASHCTIACAISSQRPRCTAARGRASRKALP